MIKFSCPECRAQLKGDAAALGNKIKCPKCSASFVVSQDMSQESPEVLEEVIPVFEPDEARSESADRTSSRRKAKRKEDDDVEEKKPLTLVSIIALFGAIFFAYVGVTVAFKAIVGKREPAPSTAATNQPPLPTGPAPGDATAAQEKYMRDWIRLLNEYSDILESVNDPASAKAAAAKIDAVAAKLEELAARNAPPLSKAESDRLSRLFSTDIEQASKRMLALGPQAAMKANQEPSYVEATKRLVLVAQRIRLQ